MTYLDTLTEAARGALHGIGLDDKVPGILDALKPVLERAAGSSAEHLDARNRIASELANLRDQRETSTEEAVRRTLGALSEKLIEDGRYEEADVVGRLLIDDILGENIATPQRQTRVVVAGALRKVSDRIRSDSIAVFLGGPIEDIEWVTDRLNAYALEVENDEDGQVTP